MGADDDLGRALVARIATHFEFGTPFYREFNEHDVVGLYRLIARLYPPTDDIQRRTGVMSDWDSIAHLRDGLPRHLSGMGTATAVTLLNGLIAEFPELSQLAYDLTLAEKAMRLKTWSPPTPKEVLAIADTPTLKLVNSAADLAEILAEALARFADSLHGAQTPVRDLWDRQPGREVLFRPIDENGFTDVVARFLRAELEHKGIFANREVEVARNPGAPVGLRTDIFVNAVRRRPGSDTYDTISAVIETKGCWNGELFTALEAQLFRDYMVRLRAQVGVYLVGWFEPDKWDKDDYRRANVPKMTVDEVRRRASRPVARWRHNPPCSHRVPRALVTTENRAPAHTIKVGQFRLRQSCVRALSDCLEIARDRRPERPKRWYTPVVNGAAGLHRGSTPTESGDSRNARFYWVSCAS
jgi:hypothetical protein